MVVDCVLITRGVGHYAVLRAIKSVENARTIWSSGAQALRSLASVELTERGFSAHTNLGAAASFCSGIVLSGLDDSQFGTSGQKRGAEI